MQNMSDRRPGPRVLLFTLILLGLEPVFAAAPRVTVVSAPDAPALECKAADLLAGYLRRLFGARVDVASSLPRGDAFVVGSPATNPAVAAVAGDRFAGLSRQGVRVASLRRGEQSLVVAGGGSPAATYWAVAELAERWGVRFTLSGDVLPEKRSPFRMPVLDVRQEPAFPIRAWRVVNDFAYGMESWGADDYRPLLDQLAKLRFNRLLVSIYPWQPFLDLNVRGIRRESATLWYGYKYPITSDMIGRGLFGAEKVFGNPDLPLDAPYPQLAAAGQTMIRNVMRQAKELGMEIALTATLTDFPPEFESLVPGAKRIHQLGAMDIVPGPGVALDDPGLLDLAQSVVETSLRMYPDTDLLAVVMPEHRDWFDQYDRAWTELDRRYGIGAAIGRQELVEQARRRADYPGGPERAVREVQGDLCALYFCDLLFRERRATERTPRPDVRILFSNLAEELNPVLQRVLPPDAELMSFIDYTPARILRRRSVLSRIPRHIPSTLLYTFQDDNIGLLPQLTTSSLAQLAADQRAAGWRGFVSRLWLPREAEPAALWAARAAWAPEWRPEQAYFDYARAVCGSACASYFGKAMTELERATEVLEWHGLGFAFPIPDMMTKQWSAEPFPKELEPAGAAWERARTLLTEARARSTTRGRPTLDWWSGRIAFGLNYLAACKQARLGGAAEAAGARRVAAEHARSAHESASRAIASYAAVAADRSDRGAIALLNEYAERPLRVKKDALHRLSRAQ